MRCSAKNRQGGQCGRSVVPGKTKCNLHGGKSRSGIASSILTHGRYSKVLPARLLERYEEAANDTELLSVREEIRLIDARMGDLIARVETGESGAVWRSLQAAATDLVAYRRVGDSERMSATLNEILQLIRQGKQDHQAWSEAIALTEQRRKLSETEQRRLTTMQQYMTSEQAMTLVTALMSSVKRNVTDRNTLVAISRDFEQLMRKPDPQRIEGKG